MYAFRRPRSLRPVPLSTTTRLTPHSKILRDNIRGITRPDIRRLARRGGVKRISAAIYDDVRAAVKARLQTIIGQIVEIVGESHCLSPRETLPPGAEVRLTVFCEDHVGRKTVLVGDVSSLTPPDTA